MCFSFEFVANIPIHIEGELRKVVKGIKNDFVEMFINIMFLTFYRVKIFLSNIKVFIS